MKPTENVLNEASSAMVGGKVVGKKVAGNTRAAAVPYRKKSYHSILVAASTVRARFVVDIGGAIAAVNDPTSKLPARA
jgi:hypothetical protein